MTKYAASLDERISTALADNLASSELATLIAEVHAADRQVEGRVTTLSAKALDPATSTTDAASARVQLDQAKFQHERLATAIGRLEAKRAEASAGEQQAQRDAQVQAVAQRRDTMAAELRERYPLLVNDLADLLQRLAAVDADARALGLPGAEEITRHGTLGGNQPATPLSFCRLVDFERRYDAFVWADGRSVRKTSALAAQAPSQAASVSPKWLDVPTLRVEVENPTRGQPMYFVNASNAHVKVAPGQRLPAIIAKADLAKVRENFTVYVLGDGEPARRAA
jgi:hypothetical protein